MILSSSTKALTDFDFMSLAKAAAQKNEYTNDKDGKESPTGSDAKRKASK